MGFSYPRENTEFKLQRIKVFSGFKLGKVVDYSYIQNYVWACQFASGRKIPSSLLDKCKRMT